MSHKVAFDERARRPDVLFFLFHAYNLVFPVRAARLQWLQNREGKKRHSKARSCFLKLAPGCLAQICITERW